MCSTLYLEKYLESLDSLPGEVRRNFHLMYSLDEKNTRILAEVDAAGDEYLRKVRELTPEQRKDEMAKIQAMFGQARGYGDDKVAIAIQTYELVDKHIRKLDADLANFESEMKEKGRLSQTETEEDEEEDSKDKDNDADTKGRKNSKGKKKAAASASAAKDSKKRKKGGDAAEEASASTSATVASKGKKGKKKGSGSAVAAASSSSGGAGSKSSAEATSTSAVPLVMPLMSSMSAPQEVLDMPVDPNEPTYCLCQQVSYGEMIGCDNSDCPIEWFHFGCMGLTTKPKGNWYCPKCLPQFKKKK